MKQDLSKYKPMRSDDEIDTPAEKKFQDHYGRTEVEFSIKRVGKLRAGFKNLVSKFKPDYWARFRLWVTKPLAKYVDSKFNLAIKIGISKIAEPIILVAIGFLVVAVIWVIFK